jgi:PPK2 family polyphosphate:nucleotide phosphotransferase
MKDVFKKISTLPPKCDKKKIKEETQKYIEIMRERQHILYAQSKYSLLIIFQGMDASGKDGATKAVFSSVNPQGVSVTSFKKPSDIESAHDFLWRIHQQCPEKGMIKIFNRSHYEDVLIPSIYGTLDKKFIEKRKKYINEFEKMLEDNGTKVLKFYLHISEEEQQKRFKERLTNPSKNWKHNPSDAETAKHWPAFKKVYQNIFEECGDVSWNIVPADKNWYKEYVIAKKIAETLQDLDLKFPKLQP